MNEFWVSITTIATAIIGLGIVSVLVSKNSQTATVINASTGGFGADILAANSPVTGNAPSFNTNSLSIQNLSAEFN